MRQLPHRFPVPLPQITKAADSFAVLYPPAYYLDIFHLIGGKGKTALPGLTEIHEYGGNEVGFPAFLNMLKAVCRPGDIKNMQQVVLAIVHLFIRQFYFYLYSLPAQIFCSIKHLYRITTVHAIQS